MSTDLALRDQQAIAVRAFGEEKLDLIKEQIGRGWKEPMTDAELAVVAEVCNRTRLDPLAKPPQIYFIKRWDSSLSKYVMTPQVGIDGLRLIASRSREYAGQIGPEYCGPDGVWKSIWLSPDPPAAARTGVYRRGFREPLWSVATWAEWAQYQDEYKGGNKTGNKVLAPFWKAKPAHMLGKTSEAMSLKRSLPAETNDLEIAHLEELQRLEAPALAARYAEIHGADEDSSLPALPYGAGAPNYEALPAGTVVENTEVEQRQAPESAPAPQQKQDGPSRGDLLEGYGVLLSTASTEGAVARPDLHKWIIPTGSSDEEIIALGRRLRAAIDAFRKNNKQVPPAEPMPQSAAIPPKLADARSAIANRLATAVEDASRLDVPFDDCRVSFPAPEEQALRACERLEERIRAKQNRLAGIAPTPGPAFDQAELEPLPFDND